MSLLTDAELGAVREVAKLGMVSDVTIYDHSVVETIDGSADAWVARSSPVKGWLHSTPTPTLAIMSGVQGVVNTYRLFLEVGTDITPGDRVMVGGAMFTVSDTTAESTWLPLLTASLRRIE